jgi:hypothetical protein
MPSRIPDGYRAVSVKVDEASQVAGFLKPGCRVDVAAVMTVRRNRQTETISKVILQDVEVAAVGQSLQGEEAGATVSRSVTLLVRPSEVPKLHLASSKGKIQLAMRNQQETGGALASATEAEVLSGEPSRTERAPERSSALGLALHAFAQAFKPPGSESARNMQTAQSGPWVVELCIGNQFKPVAFRTTDSMDRIGTGGLDEYMFTAARARQGSEAGSTSLRSIGGVGGRTSSNMSGLSERHTGRSNSGVDRMVTEE